MSRVLALTVSAAEYANNQGNLLQDYDLGMVASGDKSSQGEARAALCDIALANGAKMVVAVRYMAVSGVSGTHTVVGYGTGMKLKAKKVETPGGGGVMVAG